MSHAHPDAWLPTLRRLLAEAFALHRKGSAGVPLGRAYGAADGYMLALIELGVTNPKELSAMVADERFRLLGPATRILIDREAAEPREEARPFRQREDRLRDQLEDQPEDQAGDHTADAGCAA